MDCERLARACLAISEDGTVVTHQTAVGHGLRNFRENLRLAHIDVSNIVESEHLLIHDPIQSYFFFVFDSDHTFVLAHAYSN